MTVTHESAELDLLAEMRQHVARKLLHDLQAQPGVRTRAALQKAVSRTLGDFLHGSGTACGYDVKVTGSPDRRMQVCITIYPPQQISIYMDVTPDGVVAVPPPASERSEA